MSKAFFNTGQLRFWDEQEISLREGCIPRLLFAVKTPLLHMNKAWRFERIEGPCLAPKSSLSPAYDEEDIWITSGKFNGEQVVLRAETTKTSYLYAEDFFQSKINPPLCVWQVGKSFRRENNDGASASKLRFFEFYQQEFQCIFSPTTKADYLSGVVESVCKEISLITATEARVVSSDRLPSYSEQTLDVEVLYNNEWREMASISLRTDFPNMKVLEAAIGLDRLVSVLINK